MKPEDEQKLASEECSRLREQPMGRSGGTRELKGDRLGRNGMLAFAQGRLPEDQGGGYREVPEMWVLLKCYWASLYSING